MVVNARKHVPPFLLFKMKNQRSEPENLSVLSELEKTARPSEAKRRNQMEVGLEIPMR